MIDAFTPEQVGDVPPRRVPRRRRRTRLRQGARPAARTLPPALRRGVRDRDQARRGQLGQGSRPRGSDPTDLQRVASRRRDRRAGAVRANWKACSATDGLPWRASPPGQLPVEAAGDQGDRVPSGRLVRRLPGPARDGHVLDRAARHPGGRGTDRVRPWLQPLGDGRRRPVAVPRAGRLARGRPRRRAGGNRARHRPRRREGGRWVLPPQPHLARVVAEHQRDRGADGARLPHAPGRGHGSTRPTST